MANNIPNPLRSGTYTLAPGDSWSGDIGSYPSNTTDPAVLNLSGSDTVNATVVGYGDSFGQQASSTHIAVFNLAGINALSISRIGGGIQAPYGPGVATINLTTGALGSSSATVTGSYATTPDGTLTFAGNGSLTNSALSFTGGQVTIGSGVRLSGNAVALNGDGRQDTANVTVDGPVDPGNVFTVAAGHLMIDNPGAFGGSVSFVNDPSREFHDITLKGERPDSYSWDGNTLHLFSGHTVTYDLRIAFGAPGYILQGSDGVHIVDRSVGIDPSWQPLPECVTGIAKMPVSPAAFDFFNENNNQASIVSGQPYSGPVAGLTSEIITLNPDKLNVAAITPNSFIHTGGGDDGINFASAGGNNVGDGGTGSNFMTSGSGYDTFFNDARGATADIWNTLVNFHAGDANTLWGVTSADFNLVWSPTDGDPKYPGLTLHAYSKTGGPTVSTTFAGYAASDISKLSVSENDQVGYTYVSAH